MFYLFIYLFKISVFSSLYVVLRWLFASCLNLSCPSGNYTVSAASSVACMLFIAVCFYKVGFEAVCATNRARVPHVCPLKWQTLTAGSWIYSSHTLNTHLHLHTQTQTHTASSNIPQSLTLRNTQNKYQIKLVFSNSF